MKEFIGVSRNIYFAYDDESKALLPSCELVLIVSEPVPVVGGVENAKTLLPLKAGLAHLEATGLITVWPLRSGPLGLPDGEARVVLTDEGRDFLSREASR